MVGHAVRLSVCPSVYIHIRITKVRKSSMKIPAVFELRSSTVAIMLQIREQSEMLRAFHRFQRLNRKVFERGAGGIKS